MKTTDSGIPQDKPRYFWLVFCSLTLLILAQLLLNLSWGQPWYDVPTVLQALWHPQGQEQIQLILWDIRLPRALAALLVGASLAVSGALIQGITRNPIADPGLLGINAGAGLAMAGGYALLGSLHYSQILLLCLLGAGLATGLVLGLAYQPRRSLLPSSLILAGAMVASLFTALGQALTIAFNLATAIIGWQAGGLAATNWQMLGVIAPPILIGLIIPHLLRLWMGQSYRYLLPLAGLAGASFLLWCDLLALLLPGPPLNALVSLLLLPIFLILMRKGQFYDAF